jgi:hypothetical protein
MSQVIYVSPFFCSVISTSIPYTVFQQIDQIPDSCDLIAIAYFHRHVDLIINDLQQLQLQTKHLIVYLEEFNNPEMFEVVNHADLKNCTFFYNVVCSDTSLSDSTVISWTCSGHNLYLEPWAQELIVQLNFETDPGKKKFDCLLGRGNGRPHRDFVEQCYLRSSIKDQIIYSYYKKDEHMDQGFWPDDLKKYPYPPNIVLPINVYNQCYYSIIAETCAYPDFSFYTEKTAKAIAGKRLFVFFAGKHYLKNLKKLGFKTFDSIIDESYDQIDDDEERWSMAWQQVEKLCELDPRIVLEAINPITDHNFHHFMNTDWWANIKHAVQNVLIERI